MIQVTLQIVGTPENAYENTKITRPQMVSLHTYPKLRAYLLTTGRT
jgi:hypothetical protein